MNWWKIMSATCAALLLAWIVQTAITAYFMWPYVGHFINNSLAYSY